MTPVRRSGRQRKANPKYVEGGWDKKTLRLLRDSSESSGSSPSEPEVEKNSKDRKFRNVVIEADPEEDWSNDELASRTPRAGYGGLEATTAVHSDEDISFESDATGEPRSWRTVLPIGAPLASSYDHTRGLSGGHLATYYNVFGSEIEDLRPILHARGHWLMGRDTTLPSKQTLQDQQTSSLANWPDKPAVITSGALQSLHTRQELVLYDDQVGLDIKVPDHSITKGSLAQCHVFNLKHFETCDLSRAPTGTETHAGNEPDHTESDTSLSNRGWILNTGKRINDMCWAPNIDGDQYLTIACKATARERASVEASPSTISPAFHPSSSWPSEIQIWRYPSQALANQQCPTLDTMRRPVLVKNFKIDCGDIRQLAWSPLHCADDLRLLAILSTDGHVRVIVEGEIFASKTTWANMSSAGHAPSPLRVIKPAIDLPSPDSAVFTTMAWASTTDLAVGASDGSICLYNVLQESPSHSQQPYLTQRLHDTYIMAIATAYPSSVPFYIASSSASGDLSLTDLRSPDQDHVHIQRNILPDKSLIYAPFTRSWITLTDTHAQSLVECHHLRHFYSGTPVTLLPELSGAGTALAGSIHHPCILVGNAKGTVFATNYLRSVLPTKVTRPELGGYLQKICEYEFRPDDHTKAPSTETSGDDLFHGPDVRPGTSRFTEGFTPESIDSNSGRAAAQDQRGSRTKGKEKGKEEIPGVIFEEEQSVTVLSWNDNQRYAGWAAMGWGNGIVRVQDLSQDAE